MIGDGQVVAVSSVTGVGMDVIGSLLEPGATVVLLGPSGAGKSTLANRLGHGAVDLATGELRNDGKGRHTTTARELVRLPGGALLIDTPGLRALALWDADEAIGEAFGEIEELAAQCRFSDCGHRTEPGCAVKEAISTGILDTERYASFELLRLEQRQLAARLDPRALAEQRKRGKALGKALPRRRQALMRLRVLEADLGICRLAPEEAIPPWAIAQAWWSITKTADELSVVVPLASVPPGVPSTGPWRAFQVEGPLEHDLVGVLASIAGPLAAGGVGIFAISTFDTDYVLIPAERLVATTDALGRAGHEVTGAWF